MKLLISAIAVSALFVPAAALAQAQPQQTQTAAANSSASDPGQVICEKQEVTGSRIATRKVCMTRSQWDDARKQDRMDLEKTQTQRGMYTKGG